MTLFQIGAIAVGGFVVICCVVIPAIFIIGEVLEDWREHRS